jgi:outer membrane protein assembly factor BamB
MKRAALLLALVGCAEPTGTEADYTLQKLDAIAGEHHVVGVDTDGKDGVWLGYQIQTGVYEWTDFQLVHMDRDRTVLAQHAYDASYPIVSGIARDGDALWVNFTHSGYDRNPRVAKIAAATGEILVEYPTEDGIEDIAVRGDTLVLASLWREVITLDKHTGATLARTGIPALKDSECRGITTTADGTWIVSLTEQRIVLVDDAGTLLESAAFPDAEDYWMVDDGLHLAHDGTSFVFHRRNQILWYGSPEP